MGCLFSVNQVNIQARPVGFFIGCLATQAPSGVKGILELENKEHKEQDFSQDLDANNDNQENNDKLLGDKEKWSVIGLFI